MAQQANEIIPKSEVFVKNTIILNLVATLLLAGSVSLLLIIILPTNSRIQTPLLIIIWSILPLGWIVGSAALVLRERNTKYILGPQTLTIKNGSFFGSSTEALYRYDSMLSVESNQSFFGRKYNYGTIHITVPKLETANAVQLKAVDNPHEQAKRIKNAVITVSSHRNDSLVV